MVFNNIFSGVFYVASLLTFLRLKNTLFLLLNTRLKSFVWCVFMDKNNE